MTTTGMELHERARAVMPAGVSSGNRVVPGLERLVVTRAAGATFTDADGNEYLDFHAAFGPHVLGHADPDVDRAFHETARRVDLTGVGVSEQEIQLAERIVAHVPSIEQVFFTSSGSEATFFALRLARAHTGREKIIKFQGCYHGWHDAVALNVITPAEHVGRRHPLGAGMSAPVLESTIVVPFNDPDAVARVVEANDGQIAAIIVEPIPHNIGAVLPKPGFLGALRSICDRHGIVLVFDEVITGFRHGLGGFQKLAGVVPDVTTLGKAIANGYPIGAVGGRAAIMDHLARPGPRQVFAAGTYNGHPAVAAAALATLEKLERERVHEKIFGLGERARDGLASLYGDLGIPAVVSGFGSVFVTYFLEPPVDDYEDLLRNDAELFVGYRRELIRRGVFELPVNLKRNHISYAHRDADIDRLLEETRTAVRKAVSGLGGVHRRTPARAGDSRDGCGRTATSGAVVTPAQSASRAAG